jgi:hypothetical protein
MIGKITEFLSLMIRKRWTGWIKVHFSKGVIDKIKQEKNIEL